MNIPLSPPTDSVYKFMAIAGILLTVAGIFFPLQMIFNLEDDITEATARLVPQQVAANRLLRDIYNLEKARTANPRPNLPEVLDQSQDNNFDRAFALNEQMVIEQRRVNILRKRDERSQQALILCLCVVAVGVVISVSAFTLWWRRVQRVEDKLRQIELCAAYAEFASRIKPIALKNPEDVASSK